MILSSPALVSWKYTHPRGHRFAPRCSRNRLRFQAVGYFTKPLNHYPLAGLKLRRLQPAEIKIAYGNNLSSTRA